MENSRGRASFFARVKVVGLGFVTTHLPLPALISPALASPHKPQGCLQGLDSLLNLAALKGTLFEIETGGRCRSSSLIKSAQKRHIPLSQAQAQLSGVPPREGPAVYLAGDTNPF